MECRSDVNCTSDNTCINGRCIDACIVRGACGINALCQTVLHRPQCSCPQCYNGNPNIECRRLPNCDLNVPRPSYGRILCSSDKDCSRNLACINGECKDPCLTSSIICDPLKKCETWNHTPLCICKSGFYLSETGDLTCATQKMECFTNEDCSANLACFKGKCQNPCNTSDKNICSNGKKCVVIDHHPICLCDENCSPSVSICLRDAGCPSDTVCHNYQCINPCINVTCPSEAHCFVENHKPLCRVCPPGFRSDTHGTCLRGNHLFSPTLRTIHITHYVFVYFNYETPIYTLSFLLKLITLFFYFVCVDMKCSADYTVNICSHDFLLYRYTSLDQLSSRIL